MSKRLDLIGLLAHFSIWWLASALLWTRGFGGNLWTVLLCPFAPVLVGPSYLRSPGLWEIGVVSILSTAGLALSTLYSSKSGKRWALLLAHLSVFIYWAIDFLLIAAQT